jgi:hypothetical protein
MHAPPPRRMKTYTAESGYVYQYYFVGQREALPPQPASTEFIFDVTRDRKTTFAFSIFVERAAADAWAAEHGRPLSAPEQYAAAKLRLLRGFEEIGAGDLRSLPRQFIVSAENISELLGEIGVE